MMQLKKSKKDLALSVVLLVVMFLPVFANAMPLNCVLRNGTCNSGEANVLQLNATANAHAAIDNSYALKVCCSGVSGSSNSCSSPNSAVLLALSSATNAHVETAEQGNYSLKACVSADEKVSCTFFDNNCPAGYGCVAAISAPTNAHVSDCDSASAFATKVCCGTIPPTIANCSILSSDHVVETGTTITWKIRFANFASVPTQGNSSINCGDNSLLKDFSCTGGECSITCGDYSSNGIFSLILGNSTETSDCGSKTITINQNPAISCNVLPASHSMELADTQQFTTDCFDATSNPIACPTALEWQTTAGVLLPEKNSNSTELIATSIGDNQELKANFGEFECNSNVSVSQNPVQNPECIVTSTDKTIEINKNAEWRIFFNDFSDPMDAGIDCGDNATKGTLSCNTVTGFCQISCENYSTAGTFNFTAKLKEGAGGTPITCNRTPAITVQSGTGCSPGTCCDPITGNYRGTSFACTGPNTTKNCSNSIDCGASILQNTMTQYCAGNSSDCSGTTINTPKTKLCAADQKCFPGSSPQCNYDPDCAPPALGTIESFSATNVDLAQATTQTTITSKCNQANATIPTGTITIYKFENNKWNQLTTIQTDCISTGTTKTYPNPGFTSTDIGNYKATLELDPATNCTPPDICKIDTFFAVTQKSQIAVPETNLFLLPMIGGIALIAIALQRKKQQK